jgi:hypothetical protein
VTTPSSPHPLENEEHGLSPFPMVFQASSFSLGLNSTKVYGGQESTPEYSLLLSTPSARTPTRSTLQSVLEQFFLEVRVLRVKYTLYIHIYIY